VRSLYICNRQNKITAKRLDYLVAAEQEPPSLLAAEQEPALAKQGVGAPIFVISKHSQIHKALAIEKVIENN